MDHVFNVKTWEECEARISEIVATHAFFDDTPLVFRGQADADWRLATTLERRVPTGCYVEDYFRLIMRIKPEVETYSSRRWDDVNFKEISDWSKSYDDFSRGLLFSYEYLAYLRHHGFPSPLLDCRARRMLRHILLLRTLIKMTLPYTSIIMILTK
jgi:hypothetical protein